jgi:hypothetical protein
MRQAVPKAVLLTRAGFLTSRACVSRTETPKVPLRRAAAASKLLTSARHAGVSSQQGARVGVCICVLFYFCYVCLYFTHDERKIPLQTEKFPEFYFTVHQVQGGSNMTGTICV